MLQMGLHAFLLQGRGWSWGLQMRSSGIMSVRHLVPSAFGIIAPLIGVIWLLSR
jgi:hypothetical protein